MDENTEANPAVPAAVTGLDAALAIENTDKRKENIREAAALGADDATLMVLAMATRLSKEDTILLPEGRYSHTSRAKGWARKGMGKTAEWGERDEGQTYRVGPGRWTVCSSDGFSRESRVEWKVEHVKVGAETWTVAS